MQSVTLLENDSITDISSEVFPGSTFKIFSRWRWSNENLITKLSCFAPMTTIQQYNNKTTIKQTVEHLTAFDGKVN